MVPKAVEDLIKKERLLQRAITARAWRVRFKGHVLDYRGVDGVRSALADINEKILAPLRKV